MDVVSSPTYSSLIVINDRECKGGRPTQRERQNLVLTIIHIACQPVNWSHTKLKTFELQVTTPMLLLEPSPKNVINRMPEHGAGAPARDENGWISSSRTAVGALVAYAVHKLAPLPLLYAINQVQLTTHDHIMLRIPWEWEVSVDLFIRDVAGKGRTASESADDCRQGQRSDSSPRRFMI